MLQAKTEKGYLLTLVKYSKELIEQFRTENFFCPTCHEKVIIRAGPHTIPHFAHYQNTQCSSAQRGEGPYHEKGKLLLYQWLKKQHLKVSLEKYLPKINQRPDIFMTINNKQIAIEFQCARISIEHLKKRNEGYLQSGIQPIWILGANQLERFNRNYLKINPFINRLIHQFNPQISTFLYFFCPNTKQLMIASDIFITSSRKAAAKLRFLKLEQTPFHDLFQNHPFQRRDLYHLWQYEKRRFRLRKRNTPRGKELAWRQWLYLKRLSLETLPSEINLPVSGQFLMNSSLWDWQSRLCLELIEPLHLGGEFSFESCFNLLARHMHKRSSFPLSSPIIHPIQHYLDLLSQLQLIQQIRPAYYKKVAPIHVFKHIDEAIKGDQQVLENLFGKI